MTNRINNIIITVSILVIFITGGYFLAKNYENSNLTNMDKFAICLKDKGAIFYGAFWCPHCRNQKILFGEAEKYLPYVECSTISGSNQNKKCNDVGITSYPTWQFADNSRQTGEISLQELSVKTGCVILVP